MMSHTLVVNHSHLDPGWRWIESSFGAPDFDWRHFTSFDPGLFSGDRVPRAWFARCLAAYRAVRTTESSNRFLFVSHGPRAALYASWISGMRGKRINPHLVFSFNFTKLPEGRRLNQMARALQSVDRFAVYSRYEKQLYADYFGIAPAKIDFIPFAVSAPDIRQSPELPLDKPYVCAIGSQGRDYRLLFEAARALPSVQFCVIAYQGSVAGLKAPPNVRLLHDVTFNFAAQVAANAQFMVLPLMSGVVPCGHVTAVTAMQVSCPVIATDSVGLHDYLRHGDTAVLVEPRRTDAMIEAIRKGLDDPGALRLNAQRANDFALLHCNEGITLDYFARLLEEFEAEGRFSES